MLKKKKQKTLNIITKQKNHKGSKKKNPILRYKASKKINMKYIKIN
jgi:hypothetical protein